MTRKHLAFVLVLAVVAIWYAPGFGGYWQGDDFANLHRAWYQAQRGTLWTDTFALFAAPVPSEGAFYRPMMMLSIALNHALAGSHYGGWYALNLLVHLANCVLVALLVARLGRQPDRVDGVAPVLAALAFGLAPLPAEAVYWISARADGWVTMLTLAGLLGFTGRHAWTMPLLLVPALGFKESAAVAPLQVALVMLAMPGRGTRAQRLALAAGFAVVIAFMAWRAHLFGSAWQVYAGSAAGPLEKLSAALASLPAWWYGLASAAPGWHAAWGLLASAALASALIQGGTRMSIALAAAAGGLALATLLNLGAMAANGEGGRLWYGPLAWASIALGTALMAPGRFAPRLAAWAAVAAGAVALHAGLGQVREAQSGMATMLRALPAFSAAHPGLTLLVITDHEGPAVTGRNGQGGMVLEPVQAAPLLHRVLPTLPSELPLRRDQFCKGLATQLARHVPRAADETLLPRLLAPAETAWPRHLACWSPRERRIVELPAPGPDTRCEDWLARVPPCPGR